MLKSPTLSSDAIEHAFFTRQGGASRGAFAAMNCGWGSGDDPVAIAENRAIAAAALGIEGAVLVTARQIHSARAVRVDGAWTREDAPEVDGLVTRVPGIALGILTADCVPVLFADAESRVIGAAHAGWAGALAGILEATVNLMESEGAQRSRIVAAVGPCIRQKSYEVGSEFRQRFMESESDVTPFFKAGNRPGKYQFDLAGYVVRRLCRAGIGNVDDLDLDTCADENHFFSYRRSVLRGEAEFGRGLSAICLKPFE